MPFNKDTVNSIIIELTSYCNLHCPQCPRFDENGFLNTEEVHADVDAIIANLDVEEMSSLTNIKLEGDRGDAIMHPQINRLLEFFESKNLQVELVTNGGLRSSGWWSSLAKFKNLKVTFSIDGLADTNTIYRINSNFEKTINNARTFIDAGGTASWKFIAFKHNQHQVSEAEQLSKDIGFTSFEVEYTNRNWFEKDHWAVKVDGKFLYNIEPADQVIELREQLQVIDFTSIDQRAKMFSKDKVKPCIKCQAAEMKSVYIDKTLTVLPCSLMHGNSKNTKGLGSPLLKRLMGGSFDNNSLALHKMSDILKGPFFSQVLAESWQGKPFVHPTCLGVCQVKSVA